MAANEDNQAYPDAEVGDPGAPKQAGAPGDEQALLAESAESDETTEESTAAVDEEPEVVDAARDEYDDPFRHSVFGEGDIFYRSRGPTTVHWSVAWSDLMMTMFIFFVVMYAYQSANREFMTGPGAGTDIGTAMGTGVLGEGGGGGGFADISLPLDTELPKIYDLTRLTESEEAATLRDFASVELAPDKTVRIILTGDLLFDLGQAELKTAAREKLRKLGGLLRRTPYMVNVIGHTDNIPMHSARFPSNWELSVIRATAVTRFLIEEMRLPGERFYVTGHAYYRPVRPNDNYVNRAANRRVEIVITREVPQAAPGTIKDVL